MFCNASLEYCGCSQQVILFRYRCFYSGSFCCDGAGMTKTSYIDAMIKGIQDSFCCDGAGMTKTSYIDAMIKGIQDALDYLSSKIIVR